MLRINILLSVWLLVILPQVFMAQTDSLVNSISVRGFKLPALPDTLEFCGEPIPLDAIDVRERLEDVFYQQCFREERIILLLKRQTKYFPFFEKLLRELDAPDDLKYLAAAESSLRIDAYSHADAAGLWQFIPDTGRRWGLTVSAQVDERFHVEKSTRAAIAMLKKLHERFGSWTLAAAAYNHGAINMNAAMQKQNEDDYYALHLNKETRQYLFYIVVLKEIMSRPERYGYVVPDYQRYPPFNQGLREVTVKGPLEDLGTWCKQYGFNYKQVKYHNYWIMKYALPKGVWTLWVPDSATITSDTMAAVNDSVPAMGNRDSVTGRFYIYHTVKTGETLGQIARMYGVRVAEIMQWNSLKTDVAMLDTRLKIFTDKVRKMLYIVKPGDTLLSIALRYRVSVSQIKEWNGLQTDTARAGAELTLYTLNGD